ncbi:MAG: hypothetical protein AB7T49_17800 [Oligoflexales bacterium]
MFKILALALAALSTTSVADPIEMNGVEYFSQRDCGQTHLLFITKFEGGDVQDFCAENAPVGESIVVESVKVRSETCKNTGRLTGYTACLTYAAEDGLY